MTEELRKACVRAMHVVTSDGRVLRAGKAALFVLARTTPGWRLFARIFRIPPLSWFVELGYLIVARNRRFFAKLVLPHAKKLPPSE